MKQKLTISVIFTLILVLSFSILAFASTSSNQIDKQVDGIKATLTFKNEKVKTGSNEFSILLHDSNNQPITNAKVRITMSMDKTSNMGGMEEAKPVMIELKESGEKGQYSGTADFTTKGKWIIKTNFTMQGIEKSVDFNVTASSSGPNWLIIGGFLGVIALVLLIAGINKKKLIKA